ncbi:MAG: SH3 domain-containing protein [Phascolarctobacterium sp.]|nr:SH3 domain-containing protein [Phascolarctobacterium sp.]
MKSYSKTKVVVMIVVVFLFIAGLLSFGCSNFKYKKYVDAITTDKRIKVEGTVEKINVREYFPVRETVVSSEIYNPKEKFRTYQYYQRFSQNGDKFISVNRHGMFDRVNAILLGFLDNPSEDLYVYDKHRDEVISNPIVLSIQQETLDKASRQLLGEGNIRKKTVLFQPGERKELEKVAGEQIEIKEIVLPYYFTINSSLGEIKRCIARIRVENSQDGPECMISFYAPGLGEIEFGSSKNGEKYVSIISLKKYGSKINHHNWRNMSAETIEPFIIPFEENGALVGNDANVRKNELKVRNETNVKNIENKKCYITGNNVFKRSAPSTSASDYGFFKHNELVTVLERMNAEGREWARVRLSSGQECYVAAQYLSEKSPVQKAADDARSVFSSYYQDLNNKNMQAAYSKLSTAWQAQNPYSEWANGFKTTLDNKVTIIDRNYENENQVSISYELRCKDLIDGKEIEQTFVGSWSVIKENGKWVLDSPKIRKVK